MTLGILLWFEYTFQLKHQWLDMWEASKSGDEDETSKTFRYIFNFTELPKLKTWFDSICAREILGQLDLDFRKCQWCRNYFRSSGRKVRYRIEFLMISRNSIESSCGHHIICCYFFHFIFSFLSLWDQHKIWRKTQKVFIT